MEADGFVELWLRRWHVSGSDGSGRLVLAEPSSVKGNWLPDLIGSMTSHELAQRVVDDHNASLEDGADSLLLYSEELIRQREAEEKRPRGILQRCAFCGLDFSTPNSMKAVVDVIADAIYEYECSSCGSRWSRGGGPRWPKWPDDFGPEGEAAAQEALAQEAKWAAETRANAEFTSSVEASARTLAESTPVEASDKGALSVSADASTNP